MLITDEFLSYRKSDFFGNHSERFDNTEEGREAFEKWKSEKEKETA